MRKIILEIIGWYGAMAIILAYALNSFAVITAGSLIYQILNLTGGLGVVTISLSKKAYQPAILNIIWAIVALVALLEIIF